MIAIDHVHFPNLWLHEIAAGEDWSGRGNVRSRRRYTGTEEEGGAGGSIDLLISSFILTLYIFAFYSIKNS